MNSVHKLITLILLSTLFVVGCTESSKEEAGVKVGVIMPLSGPTVEAGQNIRKGLELGQDYVLSTQDINIEFIYEDGKCSGSEALSSYNKLKQNEEIKILTGFACSSEVLSIAPLLEEDDTYVVPITASSPLISDASGNIFRVSPNDKQDALLHSKYISETQKTGKKIGIIYLKNDYGVAIRNILVRDLDNRGYITKEESFTYGESNFRDIIIKMQHNEVEMISFIGYPENSLLFLQSMAEANYAIPVLGSWGTLSDEFFRKDNEDLLTNYLVTYFGGYSKKFETMYEHKYNENPPIYSDFAFDSVLVIAQAHELNGMLGDSFSNTHIQDGATGSISFDKKGDRLGLHTSLYKIKDGRLECEFSC